jgi:hypothetical protein
MIRIVGILLNFASAFALFACSETSHAKESQQTTSMPAYCTTEQEEPLLKADESKKPNRTLSLQLCGGNHFIWLSESDASVTLRSATRPLQIVKLPKLGSGEKYDIAVGACANKKRPIMKPLVLRTKWGQKSKISHNSGLISAWLYDASKDKVVERKVTDLACENDTP